MLRLPDPGLDQEAAATLAHYQAEVDDAGDYADQVEAARVEFGRKNRSSNATFRLVRARLEQMCTNPSRCAWCEDSEAGDIDHIRPKALYPGQTFHWPNFLRACRVCNGAKGDRFALVGAEQPLDITRHRGQPVARPPHGRPALIDPRVEDPMQLLELDILAGTFRLQPVFGLTSSERQRAEYTWRLLRLNRPVLTEARHSTYHDKVARITQFRARRDDGASEEELRRYIDGFRRHPHPTVWREMQRQRLQIPELSEIFQQVPEALDW